MSKLKKKYFSLALVLAMLILAVPSALNARSSNSWSVTLPEWRREVDAFRGTYQHDGNARVHLSSIEDGNSIWCIFRIMDQNGNWQQVSQNDRTVKVGKTETIPVNTSISKGRPMMLVVGNNIVRAYRVSASGWVIFP